MEKSKKTNKEREISKESRLENSRFKVKSVIHKMDLLEQMGPLKFISDMYFFFKFSHNTRGLSIKD